MNSLSRIGVMGAALLLTACASTPPPLVGNFGSGQPAIGAASLAGETVRWGGTIVEVSPGVSETCFQVLSRSLDGIGRPSRDSASMSNSRFVACRAGFYDPAVFSPGREVTFVGQTSPARPVKIGEFQYSVPSLNANVVYLWPVRPIVVRVQPSPFHDPWGPRWGAWGRYGRWGW